MMANYDVNTEGTVSGTSFVYSFSFLIRNYTAGNYTAGLFGNYTAGVFADLKKAFDTVDHNILLERLDYYGIRGVVKDWFRSYLDNRKQYVTLSWSIY